MKLYSVPARYRQYLEAKLDLAIEEVRRDVWRREAGLAPVVPDFMIHDGEVGDSVAFVGTPAPDPILTRVAAIVQNILPKKRTRRSA